MKNDCKNSCDKVGDGNMESHAMSMGIKTKDNGDDINQSSFSAGRAVAVKHINLLTNPAYDQMMRIAQK